MRWAARLPGIRTILADQAVRVVSIDAGIKRTVFDALGKRIEAARQQRRAGLKRI